MNFRRFMSLDKENTDFLEEASKALSGAELARDLGITRAGAKILTTQAVSHFYAGFKKLNPRLSPLELFQNIIEGFGLRDDEKGIRDVMRNLSAEQKKEVAADIKEKYPNMDVSKLGIK